MVNTPYEQSLTLNATSKILEETSHSYERTTAIAPSNQMENVRGYDIELEFLKSVFLQVKRPKLLTGTGKPFSFHTDHEGQLETLKKWNKSFPGSTFYALPLVPEDKFLSQSLSRTVFVNVACLPKNTSRIRVYTNKPAQATSENPLIRRIEIKIKRNNWRKLTSRPNCYLLWDEFGPGLESNLSGGKSAPDKEVRPVGLVLYEDGEPALAPTKQHPQRTVMEKMKVLVDQHELEFWKQGFTTGMFER